MKNNSMFHSAVALYSKRLTLYSASITKNYENSFDIVQEVFLKYLKKKPVFNTDAQLRNWLFKVTYNLCMDYFRTESRLQKFLRKTLSEKKSTDGSAFEEYYKILLQKDLFRVINHLPSHYKSVIYLKYFEDMKYSEIAEILDIPEGTVMSRLNKAKKLIGEEIKNETL